jgi:hypothetical protein
VNAPKKIFWIIVIFRLLVRFPPFIGLDNKEFTVHHNMKILITETECDKQFYNTGVKAARDLEANKIYKIIQKQKKSNSLHRQNTALLSG